MSLQRGREGSGGSTSKMSGGGSGRLWVRGQGCKLTGCVKANTASLSRPKQADPGREGRTAMPAGSRSLPVRPSLRFLKLEAKRRLAAGEFTTLHDAQTAIAREHGLPSWAGAQAGLRPASRAGKPRPGPAPLGDLAFLRRRRPGLDGARRGRAQAAFRRSLPGRAPARRPGRADQQDGRGPARGTHRPSARPRSRPWFSWPACGITRWPTPRRRTGWSACGGSPSATGSPTPG